MNGPKYRLQLALQRPLAPRWAEALRRFLDDGSTECAEQELSEGCICFNRPFLA